MMISVYGTKETECKCYDLVRRRWMRTWDVLDAKERTMDVIKGYVENETMKFLGEVWSESQRNERHRVNSLKRSCVSRHKRTIIS